MSKKISELTAGSALTGAEQMEMTQSAASKRTTTQEIVLSTFAVTASGTDTYTATPSPALTAYTANNKYFVKFTNANTGAATLNLNGLGAKSIVKNGSTALASGDIAAGQILELVYDGTNLQIVGGGGTGGILTSTTTISSAEILALNGTPKQIIAAPGANKIIAVHSIIVRFVFVSAAYTTNTNLSINYDTETTDDLYFNASVLANVADHYDVRPQSNIATTTDVRNKSIKASVDSGNPTGGDSTLKIVIAYSILDLA